jgi:LuxR family maltose regulon positive regulatory protein
LVSRLVPRTRLFDKLDGGAGARLTLVVGAPGAGKTILLADWLDARPELPAAWLSCDAGDSDPVRFMNALIRALRRGYAEPDIGEDALELLSAEGEASFDVVAAISDDIDGLAGPRVVVIDDLHLVSDASAELLGEFLQSRPASLQVVVATRAGPPLRLNRMRAREELIELGDADLAFTTDETKEFFTRFGLELPDPDVEVVHRRTEGWSTGLQLAALSIRTSPDRVSSIRRAEVHGTTVAGYFVEEVLGQQSPEVTDFMLASSVLDELSVEACTALTGEGAADILEWLTNTHMFITVSDEQAGTYRYHQLIREVLQSELHRRDPVREASLHESAARYLLDAGHAGAAARHLLAAWDSVTAFELLSKRVVRDVLTNPTVGSALDLDEFRPELFAGVPEVLVPLAAELLWRGAFDRGARAVALARQTTVDPTRGGALALRFALVNCLYCSFVGEFDKALEYRAWARSFEATVTGVDDWIVSLDALAMYCHTYLGDFREARRLSAALVAGGTSVPLTDILCPGVMSQAALLAGDLAEAAALAETTLQAARRLRFERHFFAFHALRTVSQLALERRDLQAAMEPVELALGFVTGARPAFNFLSQLDRARIWAAGGNHEEALTSLPAARAALRSDESLLLAEADELEARLRLHLGDIRGARLAAERLPSPRRAVVDVLICLSGGDESAAGQAEALLDAATREPTLRSDIELQLLRARVALLAGRRDAPSTVRSALDVAQRNGFVQTVLDTAPELLEHVVSQPDLYPAAENLRPLVNAYVDARATARSRPRRGTVEPLTAAEVRVLTKMAEHYSFGETAAELSVSINTVKTHARHAYEKLGVTSRSTAIARATVLGLLR